MIQGTQSFTQRYVTLKHAKQTEQLYYLLFVSHFGIWINTRQHFSACTLKGNEMTWDFLLQQSAPYSPMLKLFKSLFLSLSTSYSLQIFKTTIEKFNPMNNFIFANKKQVVTTLEKNFVHKRIRVFCNFHLAKPSDFAKVVLNKANCLFVRAVISLRAKSKLHFLLQSKMKKKQLTIKLYVSPDENKVFSYTDIYGWKNWSKGNTKIDAGHWLLHLKKTSLSASIFFVDIFNKHV